MKGSRQSQVTLVEVHDGVNLRRGILIQGGNQLLQDQTQCTIPTPDSNTFFAKARRTVAQATFHDLMDADYWPQDVKSCHGPIIRFMNEPVDGWFQVDSIIPRVPPRKIPPPRKHITRSPIHTWATKPVARPKQRTWQEVQVIPLGSVVGVGSRESCGSWEC